MADIVGETKSLKLPNLCDINKFQEWCKPAAKNGMEAGSFHKRFTSRFTVCYLNPEPQTLLAELNQRMAPRFKKLNKSLIELVDQYNMVSFVPLDLGKKRRNFPRAVVFLWSFPFLPFKFEWIREGFFFWLLLGHMGQGCLLFFRDGGMLFVFRLLMGILVKSFS
ncbi:hypothetical protein AgCh_016510 [Apium graveolens]